MRPTVLTIAGSDCSGGAGIQADLKAIEANLGYAAAAITAITAQNTNGVRDSFVLPRARVSQQLDAVFEDLPVGGVKTGMLGNAAIVECVAQRLRSNRPPHYVCDPVIRSSSGFELLDSEGVERLLRQLVPLASLVTPNAAEAAALSGIRVRDTLEAGAAGERLLELGARAVLVTGGHLVDRPATDLLVTPSGCTEFPGELVEQTNTHGSGCTFSAAIATRLARGFELEQAIATAKRFVSGAIRHALDFGHGNGPTDAFFFLQAHDAAGPAR